MLLRHGGVNIRSKIRTNAHTQTRTVMQLTHMYTHTRIIWPQAFTLPFLIVEGGGSNRSNCFVF